MKETLILRQINPSLPQFMWARPDGEGWQMGTLDLTETDALADLVEGRDITLLVSASDVYLDCLQVPTKNRHQLAQAIPFLVEEQLAEDIDGIHLAYELVEEGRVLVAAMNAKVLDDLLEPFKAIDNLPYLILADALVLPVTQNSLTLYIEHDRVILRAGRCRGFNLNADVALAVIQQIVNETRPEGIHCYFSEEDANSPIIDRLVKSFELPIKKVQTDWPLVFSLSDERTQPNLLPGIYENRGFAQTTLGRWTLVASVFMSVMALLLHLGASYYQLHGLQQQQAVLLAEQRDLFARTFPQVTIIVNPIVQAERELEKIQKGSASDQGRFHRLLWHLAGRLRGTKDIELIRIDYLNKELQIRCTSNSIIQLEKLRDSLTSHILTAEITSVISEDDRVEARLVVKQLG